MIARDNSSWHLSRTDGQSSQVCLIANTAPCALEMIGGPQGLFACKDAIAAAERIAVGGKNQFTVAGIAAMLIPGES
jgi:hypothetical protein